MLEAGLIASRFLHYIAALSLFGAALFPLYSYRGRLEAFSVHEPRLVVWLRRLLVGAGLLALVSGVGWFEFTTATMADSADAMMKPSVLMSMMMGTDFGPLWAARLVLTFVIVALVLRWPCQHSLWLVPLLSALLLGSLAGTGHARVTEGWSAPLHIASDAAHVIAAGMWLGGLWPLGAVIVASFREPERAWSRLAIVEVVRRFSGVATIMVGILIATGIANSWFLVGSPEQLISSTYGQMLSAKIVLFLLMALLAIANRVWITPRLRASMSSAVWTIRLRRNVIAEQALGLLVLALVSVLGTLAPPGV